MGFIDPKRENAKDDVLPGASGLRLDLDVKRCPECSREVLPWQDTCPDCGVTAVAPEELPGARFVLPGLPPEPGDEADGQEPERRDPDDDDR